MIDAPDYSQYVKPTKSLIGEEQAAYIAVGGGLVPSGGVYSLTLSAVPGYRFSVGTIIVTCNASVLQLADYGFNNTVYGRFYFDVTKAIPFSDLGAYVTAEGQSFFVIVYNLDSATRTMYISVSGILEKVS